MQQPQEEPSGDYGYDLAHDLAHDDVRAGRRPDPHTRRDRAAPPKRAGGEDLATDLGYDEAHGF